jgi:hypothetical protein
VIENTELYAAQCEDERAGKVYESVIMVSKCANPACGAKFQYLNVGRLFVIRERRSAENGQAHSEFSLAHEHVRYFWLCVSCSQSLTIQAVGMGVRLARIQNSSGSDDVGPAFSGEKVSTDCEVHTSVTITNAKLAALKKELEFLENGGYRLAMGWRAPLVFEDSPICPKAPYAACLDSHCALKEFVPNGFRGEEVPCRHIPLNEIGETLHTLYSTATMDEIESMVREWLKREIARLEREVPIVKIADSDAA